MEVITIESATFQEIKNLFAEISKKLEVKGKQQPLSDIWLDISEVCILLKISKRTLQNYRDNKLLSYSQICGKIYFKASDIEALLKENYHKSFIK